MTLNLPDKLTVEMSPFQALALVRWFASVSASTLEIAKMPAGDVCDATDRVAAALQAWLSAPLLPGVEEKPAEKPKRKRGRPPGATTKKPDVFDEAKRRLVEEHPATKGAAAEILGGAEFRPDGGGVE